MDFARIDPRRDAEVAATWHAEYDGEYLFHNDQHIEMDFLGVDSATGRRAAVRMAKRADRKVARGKKQRSLNDMTDEEVLKMANEADANKAQFYADLLVGWRNVPFLPDDKLDDPDAEPEILEFSKDRAVELFNARPWMMEGIDAFLANKSNFRKD